MKILTRGARYTIITVDVVLGPDSRTPPALQNPRDVQIPTFARRCGQPVRGVVHIRWAVALKIGVEWHKRHRTGPENGCF